MPDRVGAIIEAFARYPYGFTLDAETGEPIKTGTGYLVGGIIPSLNRPHYLTRLEVARWLTLFDAISKACNCFIGGWKDGNRLYLDATILVDNQMDAWLLASEWGEKAFGFIEDGVYVKTINVDLDEAELDETAQAG